MSYWQRFGPAVCLEAAFSPQNFLFDGIRQSERYQALAVEAVAAKLDKLAGQWKRFASMPAPSEAETEDEFIFPAVRELGWCSPSPTVAAGTSQMRCCS